MVGANGKLKGDVRPGSDPGTRPDVARKLRTGTVRRQKGRSGEFVITHVARAPRFATGSCRSLHDARSRARGAGYH